MKKIPSIILLLLLLVSLFILESPACARNYDNARPPHHRPDTGRPERPGHSGPHYNEPQFGGNIRPNSIHFVRVARVVDGDTILVTFSNGAKPQRVRMIGVNTPESADPNMPSYGKEASDYTMTMLSNRDVWLQFDAELRDRYRRLLAYVWTEKPQKFNDEEEVRWQMFNARLLLEGYAQTMTVQPNSRYARMFAKFQREAREWNRGLWWER